LVLPAVLQNMISVACNSRCSSSYKCYQLLARYPFQASESFQITAGSTLFSYFCSDWLATVYVNCYLIACYTKQFLLLRISLKTAEEFYITESSFELEHRFLYGLYVTVSRAYQTLSLSARCSLSDVLGGMKENRFRNNMDT
jgi:hypothetical protein